MASKVSPSLPVAGVRTEEDELICFGDFNEHESRSWFVYEALHEAGVQFLGPAQESTSSWVEENRKHNFGVASLEDLDSELFLTTATNVTDEADFSGECKTAVRNIEGTSLEMSSSCKLDDVDAVTLEVTDSADDGTHDRRHSDLTDGASIEKPKLVECAPVVVKPSSWASLFKGGVDPSTSVDKNALIPVSVEYPQLAVGVLALKENVVKVVPLTEDEHVGAIAEFVAGQTARYTPRHSLRPRGLVNRANWCYINANLQALLAVTPIVHFYRALAVAFPTAPAAPRGTATPLTDSMIAFFSEFDIAAPPQPRKSGAAADEIHPGPSFDPKCVHSVLPALKSSLSEKGRQEDAEEFLSFLLNGIHDELTEMSKLQRQQQSGQVNGDIAPEVVTKTEVTEEKEEEKPDQWQHIGHKNRSLTVRKSMMSESLIKSVFGGVVRSSVHQTGSKESATLQPFFTLPLDIQSDDIWSLDEALASYFAKESLDGFTCSRTNAEVEASRRSTIEELPHVFVFHIKHFVYSAGGGSQKLHKNISINSELEISRDLLSVGLRARASTSRSYRLLAVVYHHGKCVSGGHYTAEVRYGGVWLRFDDHIVKPLATKDVLKHQTNRVPYLLFYERVHAR